MPKIEVRSSGIHNTGVFAAEDIPPETFIIEYVGERIGAEEADRREIENDKVRVTYIFEVDEYNYIDGAVGGNESKYINHSCDPNCSIEREGKRVMIFSARLIKKGEELTYDYCYDKSCYEEKCHCKSHNCRGHINED